MRLFEVCAGCRASPGENIARHKGVKQAVCETAGFSQAFERNEAEGETFSLLLVSLLYLWTCEALVLIISPAFLPAAKWPLSPFIKYFFSFVSVLLRILPVPLGWIRKACAELSVENLQTLSRTHLIVQRYSCISLSGFFIRPRPFVYSG